MTELRCTVCRNPILRNAIDPSLDEGVTGAGLSKHLAEAGIKVSADIINKHRQHYKPPRTKPEPGERKRDFAILIRDRMMNAVEKMPEPEGEELDALLAKDLQPAIQSGLKAQAILDGREKVRAKQGNAELAFAILAMLRGGEATQEPKQLEDGLTIEGDYEEV